MKSLTGIALVLFMLPALASAQDRDARFRVDGYLFTGLGYYPEGIAIGCYPQCIGLDHLMGQAGGGSEVRLFRGLGIDTEVGEIWKPLYRAGLFSLSPAYHFRYTPRKSKIAPFIDAGYTRAFDDPHLTYSHDLFNFGGGIEYWAFKRAGIRLDFRGYVDHNQGSVTQYPTLRIGLVLR